jgi:hypothetical protein
VSARSWVKFGLLFAIFAAIVTLGVLVDAFFASGHWGGGLCGVGGATVMPWASRSFNRRWPKPKPGLAQ